MKTRTTRFASFFCWGAHAPRVFGLAPRRHDFPARAPETTREGAYAPRNIAVRTRNFLRAPVSTASRFLLGVLFGLLPLGPASAAEPGQNYLKDADFSGAMNDTASDWQFSRGRNEGKVAWGVQPASDGNSLFIRKRDTGTDDHVWWRQQLAVSEGEHYRLSFSAKSKGEGDHAVIIGVDFHGPDGKYMQFKSLKTVAYISSVYPASQVQDPDTWTDYDASFSIPRGAKSIGLRFSLGGTTPAEAAFRNITLQMPAVPLADVLDRAPAEIPVFQISPSPVAAEGVTLTPDWRTEGAEVRRSATRNELCLNGLWAVQPAAAGEPPVADDWAFMKIPAAFEGRGLYKYYGQAKTTWSKMKKHPPVPLWIVRDVEVPSAPSGKVGLFVSSMAGFAIRAYWNGHAVGTLTNQLGGSIDLSGVARPGEKGQLALYALPTPTESLNAFLFDGGQMVRMHDSVRAAKVSPGYALSDVFLTIEPATPVIGRAQAVPSVKEQKLDIKISPASGAAPADSYEVSVRDLKGNNVLKQGGLKGDVLSIDWKDPHLWNPDDPFLYEFSVKAFDAAGTCVDETLPERFGFREVEVRGKDILLNGRPLRLRPRLATSLFMDGAAIRRQFSFLKDIGFNCVIRPVVGNTHNLEGWATQSVDEYYRIADEMGMMIIPYTPYSIISGGQFGDAGMELADQSLLHQYVEKNQIDRLANHPSVIAYSGFGGGHVDGINTLNVRPDIWGVTPLTTPGILEKIQSDPSARAAAITKSQNSQKFIADFKRLDPSRPFLSHYDGGEGDGWGIFDYFNWTPLQEWENWPARWAKEGVMPIGSTEHGMPYPSSFLNHGIPDGNNEPWVTEYAAMRIGAKAYQQEPKDYLKFIESTYNPKTGGWSPKGSAHHYFAIETVNQNLKNVQAVWSENTKAIYRAWRTMGVPMGIEPFGHSSQYLSMDQLKKGHGTVMADPAQDLRTVGGKLDVWTFDSYWPSETMPWLPSSPSGKRPEGLTPLGETLHEVNSPLLAYIAGAAGRETTKDHVFSSGETMAKQIAVVWDGFHQRTLAISWRALVGGNEVAKGAQEVKLEPGDIQFVPVNIAAPEVTTRTVGQIEMEVRNGGEIVANDTFAVQVYPKWTLPESLKNLKITLFDPSGESLGAFQRLGLSPTTIKSLGEWKGGDVLVIGRGALSALKGQPFPAISAPVLVLEQTDGSLENLGFRAFPARTRTVFPLIAKHPVLEGVGAEDLCDWRVSPKLLPVGVEPLRDGYNYHTGYEGTVASVTLETPTRGGFTPLLQTGFDLRETPLLEAKLNGQRWLFCQLSLLDPLPDSEKSSDPVAERLLANILSYLVSPVPPTTSCAVLGGDLTLASELGAGPLRKISSAKQAGKERVLIVQKPASDPAELKAWVKQGGTAVVMPQDPAFYKAVLPAIEVRETTGSLFPLPEGKVFDGISESDFHYRKALPVLTFPNGSVAAEIADEKGRWILTGFDPQSLDLKNEPYLRLTYRHQCRALAQILTNVGVPMEKPVAEIVDGIARDILDIDISRDGTAVLAETMDAGLAWTKPEFSDAGWVPFSLSTQSTPFGDALARIRFQVPDTAKGQDLVADLGTMDDYDETYLNGVKLGSVNPENSDPERAFATARLYPIPAGLLKPGQENVLAIRFWNRNAKSKGWTARMRGTMSIRPAAEGSPYTGTYKHSDDPYLQHHW